MKITEYGPAENNLDIEVKHEVTILTNYIECNGYAAEGETYYTIYGGVSGAGYLQIVLSLTELKKIGMGLIKTGG